jgi:hypothetical protein
VEANAEDVDKILSFPGVLCGPINAEVRCNIFPHFAFFTVSRRAFFRLISVPFAS